MQLSSVLGRASFGGKVPSSKQRMSTRLLTKIFTLFGDRRTLVKKVHPTFRSQLPLRRGGSGPRKQLTRISLLGHLPSWWHLKLGQQRCRILGAAEATLTLKPTVPEALPDLYVIVSELFKQFYLMRTGQACGKQTSKAIAEAAYPRFHGLLVSQL